MAGDSMMFHNKQYVGCCKDAGIEGLLPYEDATEMAQDLGYFTTFSRFEDPKDSNFEEINRKDFYRNCDPLHTNPEVDNIIRNEIGLFLRRKDDSMYCFYSEEEDTHYFWA